MSSYKIIALLPIKLNSERVKGKNFKNFAGKPLFQWILEELVKVESIEKIVINTDAKEFLTKYSFMDSDKIIIRERKDNLIGDDVSMNLIIEDDINNIKSDLYIMTHATNPLLTSSSIEKGIRDLKKSKNKDSLFSSKRVQTRFYDTDLNAVNHDPNNLIKTQDLPLWFEENSCLYIFSKKSFEKTKSRIGSDPYLFTLPKYEAIDIDDNEEWEIAESLMLARINNLK